MSDRQKSRRQSALLLAAWGCEDSNAADLVAKGLAEQAAAVSDLLPPSWQVFTGLVNGQPTVAEAIAQVGEGTDELVVVSMHPHYDPATTGQLAQSVFNTVGAIDRPLDLVTRLSWHTDSGYVNAQARLIAMFVSSRELNPKDSQLILIADEGQGAEETPSGLYRRQVEKSAELVIERLGWPNDRARLEFWTGTSSDELRQLLDTDEGQTALIPFTQSATLLQLPASYDALVSEEEIAGDSRVAIGPQLGAYGPFMTAVKNLALRGPRPVVDDAGGPVPLLAPEQVAEPVENTQRSLVMIGASIGGKIPSEHGPEVVHSPAGVFGEVKKTRKELRAFLDWVREETPVEEAFVWSTCQRIEFYGWHSEAEGEIDHEWPVAEIRQHLYGSEPEGLKVNVLFGLEGWHHLVRTACGLNSALPGDTDVVAQLRTACRMAERIGTAGRRAVSLIDAAASIAQEVRDSTPWHRFSRGFCEAALSRVHDLTGADLQRSKHVVIGGSATSRSVLSTLSGRYEVPNARQTLVYRDHHGQMKLLRSAIGHGKRLRVHSYSDASVVKAIADADFVYFGIDHSEPVLSGEMLEGGRDYSRRPLVVIDFNDSDSVSDVNRIKGITVWSAGDLERAVESYAHAMCSEGHFARALEMAEGWIEARLPGA